MGVVGRRQELFENIVRLRRAGRELPGNGDLTAVRAALERQLGETVSRRLAARVLGVSHTALERWIRRGELPIVYSREGRMEVPVPALLDLRDAVDRDGGEAPRRYRLAPAIERQRAAGRDLASELEPSAPLADGHERARARSLAYHRGVARRLRRSMVEDARHTLVRWVEEDRIDPRYAERWERILDQGVPEIRRAIVEQSPEADDLRQNSPFAGLLSEPERAAIVQRVR